MSVAPQSPGQLHEPTKNLNAERTVLGSCLIDNAVIDIVLHLLRTAHFYPTAHQEIFVAIETLHREHSPVDIVSVSQRLERHGKLDAVGGAAYLAGFEQHVLTTQNIEHYCGFVLEAFKRRELIRLSHDLIEDCRRAEEELEDIFTGYDLKFRQLASVGVDITYKHLEEIAEAEMADLKARSLDTSESLNVKTGYKEIDELTTGLEPGDLIILAGRTSVGKTCLGLNILSNITIRQQRPGAIWSLEMSEKQLFYRLAARHANIPLLHIRQGLKDPAKLVQLEQVKDRIKKSPLLIQDAACVTVMDIRADLRRMKQEHPELAVGMVDYLQLLQGSARSKRSDSRENEVNEITRELKLTAREFELPIIALAQINRNPDRRTDKRPQLSDLRESGAIEQHSDVVLFVHREYKPDEEYDPRLMQDAEVIIAKQRNGPTTSVPLGFFGSYQKFVARDVAKPEPSTWEQSRDDFEAANPYS